MEGEAVLSRSRDNANALILAPFRPGGPSLPFQCSEYGSSQLFRKQQVFLDLVLSHYASVGVEELDQDKLPLLRLKYNNSLADALADLGRPEEIATVFAGFQKYLYRETVGA